MKVRKVKRISFCFNKLIHMTPARAPTGVKNAAKLLDNIVAYIPWYNGAPAFFKTSVKSTLIGMLFKILANTKLVTP